MTEKNQSPSDFSRSLGIRLRNPELLQTALTHPSFINERGQGARLQSNQRLEYLGDSVLGLVINQYLYNSFPEYDEGILAKLKSRIVSEGTLAMVAREMSLGKYLYLGRGERASGGEEKPSVIADALEAVIAAIYLDSGLEAAESFILKHFRPYLTEYSDKNSVMDPKSRFQELVQKHLHTAPVYEILEESGPDHQKFFRCRLLIDGKEFSQGEGFSRKKAEQDAASKALKKYSRS